MKTLLQLLNEESISAGFKNFADATDIGRVYLVEYIIEEAGKKLIEQSKNLKTKI